ncbi:DUF5325 family protein [Halalkalibacillus halophilus]|uniref:DUF5325 family protein n=1 Tax=Halalkalibacillus halophilus TaxID=392827 RepID=UPI0003FA6A72|nr:DUF5325 family protein [Halalkalibacillus halophilus]
MSHHAKMLLISIGVVLCFILTAIVISYRNYLLVALFFLAGFALMGYGFKLKKAYREQSTNEIDG